MADVVSTETRSRMMSGIRGRNTKPEILVRSFLHRHGFRYRLHVKQLKGKPDIVLPRYGAVIFVHGCFWHGHDCPLFKWPKSREEFWKNKIGKNRLNDRITAETLQNQGWRICTIWECTLRKCGDRDMVLARIVDWLRSESRWLEM